ncbi:MAG: radical SAM protein [Armatimonadota bacterium]
MSSLLPFIAKRYCALPPDLVEERGDRVLMVWGSVPYWMVVDRELHAVLSQLDGTKSLAALLAANPQWAPAKREIERALTVLRKAGVVVSGDPASQKTVAPPAIHIENVALNITRRCNLRCRFCYNLPYLTKDATGEVSAEEIGGFLNMLQPLQGKQPILTILGGEPLLEPEKLLEVTRRAAKQGFTTLVSTNGTLVSDDFARQAALIRLQVQVSLDGHTAKLHDQVRGDGAFDRTIAGIRTLVRNRAHTIVSMVCHRENFAYLENFFDLAKSLKVQEARFIPLKQLGGAAEGKLKPVPLDEMLRKAFDLFQRRPDLLSLTGRDAFAILANTCRYSSRRPSCGTGQQTVLLDADGSLYPCLNTNQPEFRIANLRDPGFDFPRIWKDSPVLERVRRFTSLLNADGGHTTCPVRFWCLGGCRGENYALTGAMEKRPPHCTELRRGIIEMFWMLSERPDLVKPAQKIC